MILLTFLISLLLLVGGDGACSDFTYPICTGKEIKITANCINNTYAKVTYSGAGTYDITTLAMACYYETELINGSNQDILVGDTASSGTIDTTNVQEYNVTEGTHCVFGGCVWEFGKSSCRINDSATCTYTGTATTTHLMSSSYDDIMTTTLSVSSTIDLPLSSSSVSTASVSSTTDIPLRSSSVSISSVSSTTDLPLSSSVSTSLVVSNSMDSPTFQASATVSPSVSISTTILDSTGSIFNSSTVYPSTTSSLSTYDDGVTVVFIVTGIIALLVIIIGVILVICCVYWQYCSGTDKEFQNFPIFDDTEMYKIDAISFSGSIVTVLQPLQDFSLDSSTDSQTYYSDNYNMKRSSSVPIFPSPPKPPLSLHKKGTSSNSLTEKSSGGGEICHSFVLPLQYKDNQPVCNTDRNNKESVESNLSCHSSSLPPTPPLPDITNTVNDPIVSSTSFRLSPHLQVDDVRGYVMTAFTPFNKQQMEEEEEEVGYIGGMSYETQQ